MREYVRLSRQVKELHHQQCEEVNDLKTALIQLKINVGILTDEMESEAKARNEGMSDVFDEIDW